MGILRRGEYTCLGEGMGSFFLLKKKQKQCVSSFLLWYYGSSRLRKYSKGSHLPKHCRFLRFVSSKDLLPRRPRPRPLLPANVRTRPL